VSGKPAVLITGASTGIGAVYADRFARRGYNLVLVARDLSRLEHRAGHLRLETGVSVDVLQSDLTDELDLTRVESRPREEARVGVLVNNAGALVRGTFLNQSGSDLARLIALNVTALTRLANAIAPRLYRRARPRNRPHRLRGDQGLRSVSDPGPQYRTGPQGHLRVGRAAIRHPHRNLGAVRS
jgi:short-subunit dehydrogenase